MKKLPKCPQSNEPMSGAAARRAFPALLFLALILLLAVSFGCAPSATGDEKNDQSASGGIPELDDATIRDRLEGSRVRKVPEENAAAEPIGWTFDESEPKEISIVEKQIEGAKAVIVLDIKTGTAPNAREPRRLAGQIRTEWLLETGWMLRRWELIKLENISMKYQNLPKPSPSPLKSN